MWCVMYCRGVELHVKQGFTELGPLIQKLYIIKAAWLVRLSRFSKEALGEFPHRTPHIEAVPPLTNENAVSL